MQPLNPRRTNNNTDLTVITVNPVLSTTIVGKNIVSTFEIGNSDERHITGDDSFINLKSNKFCKKKGDKKETNDTE